jgi:hypothetical protein
VSGQDLKTELRRILERHQGRARAVTGLELAKMLNQRDDRKIRLVIRELITEGLPVASTTGNPPGYFVAASWAEKREYEVTTKSRLIQDAKRLRDFKRAADCHLKPAEQVRLC